MKKNTQNILHSPRVTEKGAYLSAESCYVFNVAPSANKTEIAAAIRALYNVTPRKITVARIPRKSVQTRGTNRRGMTVGGKKAYVYLKKGETIELV